VLPRRAAAPLSAVLGSLNTAVLTPAHCPPFAAAHIHASQAMSFFNNEHRQVLGSLTTNVLTTAQPESLPALSKARNRRPFELVTQDGKSKFETEAQAVSVLGSLFPAMERSFPQKSGSLINRRDGWTQQYRCKAKKWTGCLFCAEIRFDENSILKPYSVMALGVHSHGTIIENPKRGLSHDLLVLLDNATTDYNGTPMRLLTHEDATFKDLVNYINSERKGIKLTKEEHTKLSSKWQRSRGAAKAERHTNSYTMLRSVCAGMVIGSATKDTEPVYGRTCAKRFSKTDFNRTLCDRIKSMEKGISGEVVLLHLFNCTDPHRVFCVHYDDKPADDKLLVIFSTPHMLINLLRNESPSMGCNRGMLFADETFNWFTNTKTVALNAMVADADQHGFVVASAFSNNMDTATWTTFFGVLRDLAATLSQCTPLLDLFSLSRSDFDDFDGKKLMLMADASKAINAASSAAIVAAVDLGVERHAWAAPLLVHVHEREPGPHLCYFHCVQALKKPCALATIAGEAKPTADTFCDELRVLRDVLNPHFYRMLYETFTAEWEAREPTYFTRFCKTWENVAVRSRMGAGCATTNNIVESHHRVQKLRIGARKSMVAITSGGAGSISTWLRDGSVQESERGFLLQPSLDCEMFRRAQLFMETPACAMAKAVNDPSAGWVPAFSNTDKPFNVIPSSATMAELDRRGGNADENLALWRIQWLGAWRSEQTLDEHVACLMHSSVTSVCSGLDTFGGQSAFLDSFYLLYEKTNATELGFGCSCTFYSQHAKCKHSLAASIAGKWVDLPPQFDITLVGRGKRKAGRPRNLPNKRLCSTLPAVATTAVRAVPLDCVRAMNEAEVHCKSGFYSLALPLYDAVLQTDPAHAAALYGAAFCTRKAHMPARTVELCDELLRLHPSSVCAHGLRAICHLDIGMYACAIRDYKEAAKRDRQARRFFNESAKEAERALAAALCGGGVAADDDADDAPSTQVPSFDLNLNLPSSSGNA
jgi:tetratricopeptide (TPR) repeat protein